MIGYPEVIHFIRSCGQSGDQASSFFTRPTGGDSSAVLGLQLPIPLGENLLLMPTEHGPRRDVPDGAVQTDVVVMVYVTPNQTARVLKGQRRSGTDAFPFE
jgi:hypothetical protein